MSRTTPEWIGKTDDTPPPPRVRLRVLLGHERICAECGTEIVGKRWICDHTKALINGGENRESNLRPIHEACDKRKTAADVAEKAVTYAKRLANFGIKAVKQKIRSRGFSKAPAQRSATRPIERASQ